MSKVAVVGLGVMGRGPEPASFATAWAYKDVEYAARLGESAGVPAHPFLDSARALLAQAVADGHGQDDWSIVNKL